MAKRSSSSFAVELFFSFLFRYPRHIRRVQPKRFIGAFRGASAAQYAPEICSLPFGLFKGTNSGIASTLPVDPLPFAVRKDDAG